MKVLESGLFAATLVLVPALGWVLGRALGRRDWRIGPVIAMGVLAAAIPNLARFALLAATIGAPYWESLGGEIFYVGLLHYEVGLFFVTLGVFMTMLGWTATPVAQPPPQDANRAGRT